MKWKKGKQKLVVIIEVDKKVYQVDLNKEQMNDLISILPQLFSDNIIKVISEELPFTLYSPKK